MKKAWPLVLLVALVLLAASALHLGDGRVESSIVVSDAQSVLPVPLPMVAESVAQSPPDAVPMPTDNDTSPVTSSGAVRASFTVVSPTASDTGEGGVSATGNLGNGAESSSAATSAREVGTLAEEDGQTCDVPVTAADVSQMPGGLPCWWALLHAIWAVELAAVGALAALHFGAQK